MADVTAPLRPRPVDTLICAECGNDWQRERRVGSPPRLCFACRHPGGVCTDCGASYVVKKGGHRRARCEGCRSKPRPTVETLSCMICEQQWERIILVGPKPRVCTNCVVPPTPRSKSRKTKPRALKVFHCRQCTARFTAVAPGRSNAQLPLCPECEARVAHCTACKVVKAREEFPKATGRRTGLGSKCLACTRDHYHQSDPVHRNARKYGLTADQWHYLAEQQGRRCALCSCPEEDAGVKGLVVDHCHATGAVRALLCGRCNTGIGLFRDDPALLEMGARYLRSHSAT